MTARILLAPTVAIAAVAGFAGAGRAAPSAAHNCGNLKAGGRTWTVIAAAAPCSTAKTLVRHWAPKVTSSRLQKLGIFDGYSCGAITGHGRSSITCVGKGGTFVQAVSTH